MNITVVIPCLNHVESTHRTIKSILRKDDPNHFRLVLIDNGSTDGTQQYLSDLSGDYSCITYIRYEKNIGFPASCNHGIDFAQENDDILFLNNDVEIFDNEWLVKLNTVLYENSETGLVYPLIRTRGILYFGGFIENRKEMLLNYDMESDRQKDPVWAQFCCVLLKRSVLEEIGYLDEQFSPGYFEDVDWCLRMKKAGYRMKLVDSFFVEHYQSVTAKSMKLDHYRYKNREKFYFKWPVL
jgi:GT2 family glycosyltransferase